MEKRIICNQIQCPDGTILISHHRHDFVIHKDIITGKKYAVDGGTDYIRRVCEDDDYIEQSIYSDAPFTVIRENYYRGTFNKNGDRIWISISQMSDKHLENCINYNIKNGLDKNIFANQMYRKELEYRKENNIKIEEITLKK